MPTFERKYHDETDWEEVSWDEAMQQLGKLFTSPEAVLADIENGNPEITPYATYRLKTD